MEVKIKGGRKFKLKKNISLDERDYLLDSIDYQYDEKGNFKSINKLNSTVTKFLRICLDGGNSDKELMDWSIEERTEAFLKIQEHLNLGEGNASK